VDRDQLSHAERLPAADPRTATAHVLGFCEQDFVAMGDLAGDADGVARLLSLSDGGRLGHSFMMINIGAAAKNCGRPHRRR
jgi:hypothetical protein